MTAEADIPDSPPLGEALRSTDSLKSLIREVRGYALICKDAPADQAERDAMVAVAYRAERLQERLQAIVDWADFAMAKPNEFNSHGVRNLDGPIFDEARAALSRARGEA